MYKYQQIFYEKNQTQQYIKTIPDERDDFFKNINEIKDNNLYVFSDDKQKSNEQFNKYKDIHLINQKNKHKI